MTEQDYGADYGTLDFTVRRMLLHKLAEWAVTVVPTGHVVIPVYSCFRVEVAPKRLCLAASNGERAVWAATEAVSTRDTGVIYMPARTLHKLLAEASEGEVRFSVKKNMVTVTAGGAHWDLKMPPGGSYHELPDLAAATFSQVSREGLLGALKIVRHAVGKDTNRPQYAQVGIAPEGGDMFVTAADSNQYSRVPLPGFPFAAGIPVSVVDDLMKLLAGSPAEHVDVADAGGDLVFRTGPVTLAVRKLDKPAADMSKTLAEVRANEDPLGVDRGELMQAIRRVRIISDTQSSAIALVLDSAEGRGTVTVESKNRENVASETVPATWSGGSRVLVVSGQFLYDLLAAHPSRQCTFRVSHDPKAKGRRKPLLLEDPESGVAGRVPQMPPELAGLLMVAGVLKQGFNKDRGFGFIAPHGGGEDVFLHVRDLIDPSDKDLLVPGAPVTWEQTVPGQHGKPRAVRARVLQGEGDGKWFALALQPVFAALDHLIAEARAHGVDV